MISLRRIIAIITVMIAMAALFAACGSETIVDRTVIVEKIVEKEVPGAASTVIVEVDRTVVVEVEKTVIVEVEKTVVVVATPVPSGPVAGTVPEPQSASGTVVIALSNIARDGGSLNRAGRGQDEVFWGAAETLFTTAPGPTFSQPWLVKSWDLATDLSKVRLTLQKGVQFHKGYGEMTAEDVVWSINDANNAVTTDSVHLQAGDLAGMFGPWEVVDTYVVDAPFTTFDPRWMNYAISDGFQPTAINSKAAYDEMGEEWARDNVVATGPFEVREWLRHDRVVMDAVTDHWRQPPQIDVLRWREIPDATTRLAALLAGEVDIGVVQPNDIQSLLDRGFRKGGNGQSGEINISMSGNYWEKVSAITGEPVTREGFDPSKPWIGDPDDAASMEQARLVRWALATAIDREAIANAFGGGFATPSYIGFFNPIMTEFQDKWKVPYDPDMASGFLESAGYPDGFEISIFGRSNTAIHVEAATAVAGYWRDIGLAVTVESFPYAVWRPTLVERQANTPWVSPCESGRQPRPWDWAVGTDMTTISRGGFGCAVEIPFLAEKFAEIAVEPDMAERIKINNDVADYLHNWMILPGVMTIPGSFIYNPRSIESWVPRPSLLTSITAPENIVPVK